MLQDCRIPRVVREKEARHQNRGFAKRIRQAATLVNAWARVALLRGSTWRNREGDRPFESPLLHQRALRTLSDRCCSVRSDAGMDLGVIARATRLLTPSTTATRCDFVVGRYDVIRELGGGGMKVVYHSRFERSKVIRIPLGCSFHPTRE
jgi:hypothetical protein